MVTEVNHTNIHLFNRFIHTCPNGKQYVFIAKLQGQYWVAGTKAEGRVVEGTNPFLLMQELDEMNPVQ